MQSSSLVLNLTLSFTFNLFSLLDYHKHCRNINANKKRLIINQVWVVVTLRWAWFSFILYIYIYINLTLWTRFSSRRGDLCFSGLLISAANNSTALFHTWACRRAPVRTCEGIKVTQRNNISCIMQAVKNAPHYAEFPSVSTLHIPSICFPGWPRYIRWDVRCLEAFTGPHLL